MKTKELHEGIGGNGNAIWIVVTVNEKGIWIWQEMFKSKSEAESWIKWA